MKITNWNKLEKDYWENNTHTPALRVWIDDVGGSYEVHAGEQKTFTPCIHLDTYITKKTVANKLATEWMKNHI